MKLWDRIKRGMDAGFDAAVSAVHNITEKAGESIELTRLRREPEPMKMRLPFFIIAVASSAVTNLTGQIFFKSIIFKPSREPTFLFGLKFFYNFSPTLNPNRSFLSNTRSIWVKYHR